MSIKTKIRRGKRILALICLVLLVAAAVPVILHFARPAKTAQAAWFNDNWNYRALVTITNASDVTNQTVSVANIDSATLVTAGKMQSDCGDTVWTDAGGNMLSYMLVSGCNSSNTTYSILVPTINNGKTQLYYYYGNVQSQNMFKTTLDAGACSGCTVSAGSEETGPGPVLWLSFDEMHDNGCPDGSDICDKSGHGNNASFEASSAHKWDVPEMCVIDTCITLHGTPDAANITDNNSLDFGTGSFTVQAWVRDTSAADNEYIFSKEAAGTNGGYSLILSGSTFRFRVTDNGTLAKDLAQSNGTQNYHDMKWHFVTGVKNGTSNILIYVDGQLAGKDTALASTGSLSNNLMAYVAEDGTNAGGYVNGSIDELKIFPYARSASEIAQDYNRTSSVHGSAVSVGIPTANEIISDGLVSWWRLDETTGTNPVNSGERSLDLSRLGSPTMISAKYGNGGDLESSTAPNESYFSRADTVALSITGDLSIAAWIKPESNTVATQYDIVDKFDTGTESYSLVQYGDELRMYINSSSNYTETTQANLATGTWYFVTGVYNSTSQTIQIYVNGVQMATSTTGVIPSSITDTTSRSYIGAENYDGATASTASNGYDGVIDEVRIYESVLSKDTINTLYKYSPGPTAWYKLDEGSGNTPTDSSGYGFHLSSSGSSNNYFWVPGKYGFASGTKVDTLETNFFYNDTNATVGDLVDVDNTQDYSISFWYRARNAEASSYVPVAKGGSTGSGGYRYAITDSNVVRCSYTDGNGAGEDRAEATVNGIWNDGLWHYAGCVMDRSGTVNGTPAYYVWFDGQQRASNTTLTEGSAANTTADLTIGEVGNTTEYDGAVDDVKFYRYVRTPSQITEDMNGGHPAPGSPVGSALGEWRFDEGIGSTLANAGNAGSSLNGTITSAAWTNDGKFDKALVFNGSDSLVDFGINSISSKLNGASGVTLSTWFKASSYPGGTSRNRLISIHRADGSSGALLSVYGTNQVEVAGRSDGADALQAAIFTVPDPFSWHHLTGVFDYPNDRIRVYIDGRLVQNSVVAFNSTAFTTGSYTNASDTFGAFKTASTGDFFNGIMDQTKVFNIALTDDQVKLEYNRSSGISVGSISTMSDGITASNSAASAYCVPGDTAQCGAPFALWKMDETSGSTIFDYSGNGYNATINGSVLFGIGRLNGGIRFFDTIVSQATVPDNDAFDWAAGESYTIEGWFNRNDSESQDHIIDKRNTNSGAPCLAGEEGWILWMGSGVGDLNYRVCDTDHDVYDFNGLKSFRGGGWHFFAITWDDTSENNTQIYADGRDDLQSRGGTFANIGDVTNAYIVCIGDQDASNGTTCSSSTQSQHDGFLDNIAFFNYARTPAQIAWDYNRGGPMAWYKLDECQGSTVYNTVRMPDGVAAGLDGTLTVGTAGTNNKTGSCTGNSTDAWFNGANGRFGSAINLDGTDDYVDMGDQSALDFLDGRDFTIEAWFNRESFTSDHTIIAKKTNQTAAGGYILYIDDANDDLTFVAGDSTNYYVVNGKSTFTSSGWNHVVAVFDDDSTTNTTIYVNGVNDKESTTNTLSSVIDVTTTSVFRIGAESDGTAGTFFDGKIDDVKVYHYAMNAAQAKEAFNRGSALQFAPVTGSP